MSELEIAIKNFKIRQERNLLSGKKESAAWGKWNDSHNINNVIYEALKIYYINQFKRKFYATNLFSEKQNVYR